MKRILISVIALILATGLSGCFKQKSDKSAAEICKELEQQRERYHKAGFLVTGEKKMQFIRWIRKTDKKLEKNNCPKKELTKI